MNRPSVKRILKIAAFVVSIIVFVLTIFAAYGGRIDPDLYIFPSVLTLVLPWLAWISIITTVIWFCFRNYIAGCIGVLTILVSWSPISTASPIGWSKSPTPGAQTFTLMTYNMIHGWDQEKQQSSRNRTIDFILETDADIVCLQEVKSIKPGGDIPNFTPEQNARLKEKYPYRVGDSTLDTKVLSKYPARFVRGDHYIKEEYDIERYTFYKVDINGRQITLINLHLQSFLLNSKEREVVTEIHSINTAKESYEELKGDIRSKFSKGFRKRKTDAVILRSVLDTISGPVIVCGDFNDVPESFAYRTIRGSDLKDAYVETGFGPLITYNQHAFWFHLDQILYNKDLRSLNVRKIPTKLSDHYPVIAEFELKNDN